MCLIRDWTMIFWIHRQSFQEKMIITPITTHLSIQVYRYGCFIYGVKAGIQHFSK